MILLEFLAATREKISFIRPGQLVHLVMGNESGDLDSMVSSIILAFHYSALELYQKALVIPVLNQTKQLFPVRVENIYLLEKYGIPLSYLVFRDDINLEYIESKCKLSISLVDHHVLPASLKFLKESVTEVIDHRPEDPAEVWNKRVYKDIQLVGSCCTLIFTHINHKSPSLKALEMLYDVITYDTIAYCEEAGKVKPLDLQVASQLEKLLAIEPDDPVQRDAQRTARFVDLYNAHINVSRLTTELLLYKDLKIVGNVYVPGLPMLVETYLQRSDVNAALEKFSADNNAEILLLMGLEVNDGQVTRDLAIYTSLEDHAGRIEAMLVSHFEAERKHPETCKTLRCFSQKNHTLSRKQLIPLLKLALEM